MPETEDGASPAGESGKGLNRGLKITLISLAVGGLIAGLVLVLVSQLDHPYFSPPDEAREWARQNYEDTLLGSSAAISLPTLSATPPQSIKPTFEAGKVTVEVDGSLGNSNSIKGLFEIFTADENGEVVLPTGNRLKLSSIAVVMPEDLSKDESDGGMAKVNWHDPETLERLPEETGPDWETKKWVQGRTPEMFLKVSNEGGKPIRWLGVEVFDERTLIQVQSGCSFQTHTKEGDFGIGLENWHQAPLMIAVQFSFGDPEFRDMDLEPEAEVRFGDDGLVRVLAVAPRGINSSGSRSHTSPLIQKFYRYPTASEPGRRRGGQGVVFHVWPAHNEKLIDFVIEEKKENNGTAERFLSAWGNDGITQADFPDSEKLVSVKARRMPRIGRAVFRLPRTPRLPETDNLFDTPITRVTFNYRHDMEQIIGRSSGMQYSGSPGGGIPDSHFPMVLEDTTPVEILRLNERLAGRRLFYDRKKMKLSSTRSGMLKDLKEWWRRNKYRWLP